jgi:diacylglycerol kinase (ATP)
MIAVSDTSRQRYALLVINEKSRQGHVSADAAVDTLERGGMRVQREICLGPDELSATILRLAGTVDLVGLGGGDGTLNSAAPALIKTGLPLGILPLGTANDLARTLGIPTDLREAAQVIVNGHIRRIDLGEVNGKPFFNVASLGLSVRMTRELTHDVKQRWGKLGYAVATWRALSRLRPFSAEIRYDGQVHQVRTLQISVGNGRHYGGGMTVKENAKIDDEPEFIRPRIRPVVETRAHLPGVLQWPARHMERGAHDQLRSSGDLHPAATVSEHRRRDHHADAGPVQGLAAGSRRTGTRLPAG